MSNDMASEPIAGPIIPACLQTFADQPRWVLWRYGAPRPSGKIPKEPYQVNGTLAHTNKPETWATLADVQAVFATGGWDGIGMIMHGLAGVVGIDLDKARDPETGKPVNEAFATAITCGSYCEVSPSGTGYRIFGKADLTKGWQAKDNDERGFEIYGCEDIRYLTVTGQRVEGAPDELRDVTELIAWLKRSGDEYKKQKEAEKRATNVLPLKRDFAVGGVPALGDRSSRFYGTVCKMKEGGLTLAMAEAALRADPHTTGAIKYLEPTDRLSKELDRVWNKRDDDPQGEVIEAPPRQSRFFNASELAGIPVKPQPWLVHGMIPTNTVTLFGGDGGTGKSLAALQLAVSVSMGRDWLGMQVASGRALFLSAEDDGEELHRRLNAIRLHHGVDWSAMSGLTLRTLAGEDALLAVETKIALMQTTLFDEIEARAKGEQPVLIVLDTLADMYPANENDRAKVRQFIGILRGLAIRNRCAVVLLSHPSLTGMNSGSGTSGSTAWNNSVRSRLYLERIISDTGHEADPDERRLTTKKANYGRVGSEMLLKWERGVFVSAGAVRSVNSAEVLAHNEEVFLKLLSIRVKQGLDVSPNVSNNYAPKVLAKLPEAKGISTKALETAMLRLLEREMLKIEEKGPPSRRVKYLVPA